MKLFVNFFFKRLGSEVGVVTYKDYTDMVKVFEQTYNAEKSPKAYAVAQSDAGAGFWEAEFRRAYVEDYISAKTWKGVKQEANTIDTPEACEVEDPSREDMNKRISIPEGYKEGEEFLYPWKKTDGDERLLLLTVPPGKKGGDESIYDLHVQSVKKQRVEGIIVQESGHDDAEKQEETDGGLSKEQVKDLFHYMSYKQYCELSDKTKFQIFNAHRKCFSDWEDGYPYIENEASLNDDVYVGSESTSLLNSLGKPSQPPRFYGGTSSHIPSEEEEGKLDRTATVEERGDRNHAVVPSSPTPL